MKRVAFIMAGGLGQRLKPFTLTIPKPALPIAGTPIIGVVLKQLEKFDFDKVFISLGYKGYMIKAMVKEEIKPPFEVEYLEDIDFARGTAGALKLMKQRPENIFVLNGDILTDLDFAMLWDLHCENEYDATIALAERKIHIDYGVVEVTDGGKLSSFSEKPTLTSLVSMGINIIKGSMIDLIPNDISYDMPSLLEKINENSGVHCHCHKGYWQDIGRMDDFEQASIDFAEDESKFI